MLRRMWAGWFAGNCRGDECEASIYSKTYTEGSDPLGPRGEKTTVAIMSDPIVPAANFFAWGGGTISTPPVLLNDCAA